MTCVICERRPAHNGGFCPNCGQKIEAAKRRAKPEEPFKFATYRGHVVGFFRDGGGRYVPRLLNRNPERLPKTKTLDLNHYIEGFTRAQIKRIKSTILQLAKG